MFRTILYAWLLIAIAMSTVTILTVVVQSAFLPSENWVARSKGTALVLGASMASFTFLVWWIGRSRDYLMGGPSRLQAASEALGMAIVAWFVGYLFVLDTLPTAHAFAVGDNVSLGYVVEQPLDITGQSGCVPAIKLENMPIFSKRFCRPAVEFTEQLTQGSRVYANGTGSPLGVFYKDIALESSY